MQKYPKKPKSGKDKLLQMYQNDRKVLRFYGYWDDRGSSGGYIHNLTIQYYLMDNTVEVIETNAGTKSLLIKRGKLYKVHKLEMNKGCFNLTCLIKCQNYPYKINQSRHKK